MKQLYLFHWLTGLCGVVLLFSCKNEHNGKGEAISYLKENKTISYFRPNKQSIRRQIRYADSIWDYYPDTSFLILTAAVRYSILANYPYTAACALAGLGKWHLKAASYDSSLFYFKNGLRHAKKITYKNPTVSLLYNGMALVYFRRLEYDSAAFYLYKALRSLEAQQMTQTEMAFDVYNNISSFWLTVGDDDKALSYLNKAEQIALHYKDSVRLMNIWNSKAGMYDGKGYTDKAQCLYVAILSNPSTSIETHIYANMNIGEILSGKKMHPYQAIAHFKEALRLSTRKKDQLYIAHILAFLGNAYVQVGQYETAEDYLKQALQQEKKTGLGLMNTLAHQNLAQIYANKQQYKLAFEQMILSIDAKDSLLHKEKVGKMNSHELQYRISERERQLAYNQLTIAQQQHKIQNHYLLIGGISSASLIILATLFGILRRKKQKTEIERLKNIMVGEERERNRMAHELHEGIVSQLYAVKRNISALPVEHPATDPVVGEFQEIIQQLEQSITDLDMTTHNLLPEALEQKGLEQAISSYCQKINLLTHCHIECSIQTAIPPLTKDFKLTVYRIFQELVQNIIKHSGATQVKIQFHSEDTLFNITITDNGFGIPPEQWGTNNGIGLHNLRDRIKSVNGKMEVETQPGKGTSVYLNFHLQNYRATKHDD